MARVDAGGKSQRFEKLNRVRAMTGLPPLPDDYVERWPYMSEFERAQLQRPRRRPI